MMNFSFPQNSVQKWLTFVIILVSISLADAQIDSSTETYANSLSISTWINFDNPITGIKYQNNSAALGYFVNIKTDLDVLMATAGPSFTVLKGHNLYFGAGSFDGVLALELGVSIQRRKIAFDLGLDYVPADVYNFLVPTLGIGINF